MEIQDLLYILVAVVLCIYGMVLLIRMLRNMEKEQLDIWLGFVKFFLGTFVIGLLGFFAKLSFESRQMAVTESQQIGQYVEKAMLDDIEQRLRFAKYFMTVLPEDHNTRWDAYHKSLIEEDSIRNEKNKTKANKTNKLDSIQKVNDSLSKLQPEQDSLRIIEMIRKNTKLQDAIYGELESVEKELAAMDNLNLTNNTKGNAAISNPDDFVTCRAVENLMPYGRTSSFTLGKHVYVHAFIKSPRPEIITIIWRDYKGKEWNRTTGNIGINNGRGFRLYDKVNPKNRGGYSVEMRNSANEIIGFRKFTVK